MRSAHGNYARKVLSALQHRSHMGRKGNKKETDMAYIPARPIIAEDPLAYFAALVLPTPRPAPALAPVGAIEQMFGYYSAE
jgi:hypothetical protein